MWKCISLVIILVSASAPAAEFTPYVAVAGQILGVGLVELPKQGVTEAAAFSYSGSSTLHSLKRHAGFGEVLEGGIQWGIVSGYLNFRHSLALRDADQSYRPPTMPCGGHSSSRWTEDRFSLGARVETAARGTFVPRVGAGAGFSLGWITQSVDEPFYHASAQSSMKPGILVESELALGL